MILVRSYFGAKESYGGFTKEISQNVAIPGQNIKLLTAFLIWPAVSRSLPLLRL